MIVAGRTMLPWIFSMVAKTGSREIFTLAVMTSAIGLAYAGAAIFDVSFALGAFFAGIMIRESGMSKKVTERSLPFQDAFAVLFFVSVGMLFNPYIIFTEPSKVMISTFIIVIGKSLAALAIVAIFRYPFKTGLIVAAGLAQIGEFSFILVGLGIINGLIPPVSRDLVFAGALISIMINPILFAGIKAISQKMEREH